MNKQLILNNIKSMEAYAAQDDAAKACTLGLSLVRMMIDQMKAEGQDDTASRSLYIGYAGVTASLAESYAALLKTYSPSADAAGMATKIEEAQKKAQALAAEKKEIEEKNSELLAKKAALEQERTELEKRKQEIEGIRKLKEETLVKLREEVDKLSEELKRLEKALDEAKAESEKWRSVFDEDMRLLGDLPETIAEKTADELIGKAKEYAASAGTNAQEADKWLLDVINAVEGAGQRLKQA